MHGSDTLTLRVNIQTMSIKDITVVVWVCGISTTVAAWVPTVCVAWVQPYGGTVTTVVAQLQQWWHKKYNSDGVGITVWWHKHNCGGTSITVVA